MVGGSKNEPEAPGPPCTSRVALRGVWERSGPNRGRGAGGAQHPMADAPHSMCTRSLNQKGGSRRGTGCRGEPWSLRTQPVILGAAPQKEEPGPSSPKHTPPQPARDQWLETETPEPGQRSDRSGQCSKASRIPQTARPSGADGMREGDGPQSLSPIWLLRVTSFDSVHSMFARAP